MDFWSMMDLEGHGPDTFVGAGPRYPWGGLYGGQIAAQALRAASLTVDDRYRVHSLHAYFIRPGDHTEPVRYEVDRIRNGRSFVTRRVVARQAIGAIFNMAASFQVDEDAAEVQTEHLPDVPQPDDLDNDGPAAGSWSDLFDRRFVGVEHTGARAMAWLRLRDEIGDDPSLQACGLTYLSDDLPTDGVARIHPADPQAEDFEGRFMNASLDHAIWFHRPGRADEWHLHDIACHGLRGGRGLSIGRIFAADGSHLATLAQEVLFRERR